MHRLMRYTGSKIKFVNRFNSIVRGNNLKIYAEPFLGSGAIFCNLEKEYELYRLNDLNKDILSIWEFVKECTYKDFEDILKHVNSFGSLKDSKENYYKYRNFYNENYHFTEKIEKGAYLYHLVNSTINSFARFGPNGFNNSYGARHYIVNKNTYDFIHYRLQRAELSCLDYSNVNYKDSLSFFDPPYFERSTSYNNNFKQSSLNDFLLFLKSMKNYVYTDMLSPAHSNFHLKPVEIKDMVNTRPGTKGEITGVEVYFTDIKKRNLIDEWL